MAIGLTAPSSDTQVVQPPGWRTRFTSPLVVHVAVVLLAALLWAVSLPFIAVEDISGWGLLTALPLTWWLALGLAVLGHGIGALSPRLPAPLFWSYQVVLVLVLFGTTSVVYDWARYPWTYKHVGVVEHLLVAGVDRSIDIYNNWPGFFALAALIVAATGVDTLTLAQWAEPFFALSAAVAVGYAVRALTSDARLVRLAVLIFILGNWIGSNYFSPQALATVLATVFLGLVLRTIPVRDSDGALSPRSIVRRIVGDRSVTGLPVRVSPLTTGQRVASLTLATVIWVALVTTHQLTPVAVLMQMGVLAVLLRVRHLWLLVVWLAVEIGWLALAWPYLSDKFVLFQSDALSQLAWPGTDLNPALPGMAIVGACAPILVAVIPLLAAGYAVRAFLRRRTVHLLPLLLGFTPPLLLIVQTYGGEGVFRVYLYGLPWLALLLAHAIVRLARRRRSAPVLVAAVVVFSVLSVGANFGQELINHVRPGDALASRWYEENTPPGSEAVTVTGLGFPLQMTEQYPTHKSRGPSISDLTGSAPLAEGNAASLEYAVDSLQERSAVNGYLVITPGQMTYGRMYGLTTAQEWAELTTYVRARDDLEVVYDADEALIVRFRD